VEEGPKLLLIYPDYSMAPVNVLGQAHDSNASRTIDCSMGWAQIELKTYGMAQSCRSLSIKMLWLRDRHRNTIMDNWIQMCSWHSHVMGSASTRALVHDAHKCNIPVSHWKSSYSAFLLKCEHRMNMFTHLALSQDPMNQSTLTAFVGCSTWNVPKGSKEYRLTIPYTMTSFLYGSTAPWPLAILRP
jgi:hypothetical protein